MQVGSFVLTLLVAIQVAQAEDLAPFSGRIYTPELILVERAERGKGSVQFLWEKQGDQVRYEIEIHNGRSVFSSITERHYFHTMLHLDRDYRWRVRSVGATQTTDFSAWRPLRLAVKDSGQSRQMSGKPKSLGEHVEEVHLDSGAP